MTDGGHPMGRPLRGHPVLFHLAALLDTACRPPAEPRPPMPPNRHARPAHSSTTRGADRWGRPLLPRPTPPASASAWNAGPSGSTATSAATRPPGPTTSAQQPTEQRPALSPPGLLSAPRAAGRALTRLPDRRCRPGAREERCSARHVRPGGHLRDRRRPGRPPATMPEDPSCTSTSPSPPQPPPGCSRCCSSRS